MNIFQLKSTNQSPAGWSSSLISRSLMAKWKPLALSSIIQLLFGTEILSSTIAHIVQTATWTRRARSSSLYSSLYIYFIQSVEAAVSRAVGLLMKDSVCSNHLDICCCFEASHCLVRVSVHSRRWPRATSRPQLSDELSTYKEGTVRQRGICSVEIDEDWGGSVDGGWYRGGRSADHRKLSRWCCCWRGNNHHLERMIASNGVHASNTILENVSYVGFRVVYQKSGFCNVYQTLTTKKVWV